MDRERKNGRFLLTGSANLMTLRTVSESLTGLVALHQLPLLVLAAVRTGEMVNVAALSRELALPETTVRRESPSLI